MIEANPKIVRVEKAVTLDVLKGGQVRFRALCGFTQQKFTVTFREVAALAVRGRALGNLHQERLATVGKIVQQVQIQRRSEIVRVGYKQKLHAFAEQAIQPAGTDQ